MSILYPVAASAEAALAQPKGRAAREREAARLAGGPVSFVTEATGPAFGAREDALDAFAGRLDDPRPGHAVQVSPEDRFCALAERTVGAPPAPVEPAFVRGRRWPKPRPKPARTVFRLTVSIGIAVLDRSRRALGGVVGSGLKLGELIGAADGALSQAKATGRNKVCVVPPSAEQG